MEFERVLAEAEALLMERPLRSELDPREIERIASFFYVSELGVDEEGRREGGSEASFYTSAARLFFWPKFHNKRLSHLSV
jgi:hypothetical protein